MEFLGSLEAAFQDIYLFQQIFSHPHPLRHLTSENIPSLELFHCSLELVQPLQIDARLPEAAHMEHRETLR